VRMAVWLNDLRCSNTIAYASPEQAVYSWLNQSGIPNIDLDQ
jgi:hypothetical protein